MWLLSPTPYKNAKSCHYDANVTPVWLWPPQQRFGVVLKKKMCKKTALFTGVADLNETAVFYPNEYTNVGK